MKSVLVLVAYVGDGTPQFLLLFVLIRHVSFLGLGSLKAEYLKPTTEAEH